MATASRGGETRVETRSAVAVTVGELAAEAGVTVLALVIALLEAGHVTVESWASATGLGTGEAGGALRVTLDETALRAWVSEWARRREYGRGE